MNEQHKQILKYIRDYKIRGVPCSVSIDFIIDYALGKQSDPNTINKLLKELKQKGYITINGQCEITKKGIIYLMDNP